MVYLCFYIRNLDRVSDESNDLIFAKEVFIGEKLRIKKADPYGSAFQ
jgi:hypothetical protein